AFSKLPLVKEAVAANRPLQLEEDIPPTGYRAASPAKPASATAVPAAMSTSAAQQAPNFWRQGRSEGSLVSGVPLRPFSAAPPASVKAEASPEPKASASPSAGASALAKLPKQVRAAPELCDRHLQWCGCEHWKVVHKIVFVRAEASTESEPLALLREGCILCVARRQREDGRSPDGKWVRLGQQAKVWQDMTWDNPDYVASKQVGFEVACALTDD
ncbi:unnamed protein product, partial [Effrenium voratum]